LLDLPENSGVAMAILNRNITYRGKIKISSADLKLARLGKKRCTIRLGVATVIGDSIDLTDGREQLTAQITSVDSTRSYSSLNEEDALNEGFDSTEQLLSDLSRFYGKIEPMQPITIIYFRVDERDRCGDTELY
jgi:hypothetical protein